MWVGCTGMWEGDGAHTCLARWWSSGSWVRQRARLGGSSAAGANRQPVPHLRQHAPGGTPRGLRSLLAAAWWAPRLLPPGWTAAQPARPPASGVGLQRTIARGAKMLALGAATPWAAAAAAAHQPARRHQPPSCSAARRCSALTCCLLRGLVRLAWRCLAGSLQGCVMMKVWRPWLVGSRGQSARGDGQPPPA